MTLPTGTKLSHYQITSQIGKGGMGEVYQAKDTKLGRDVAIKVLPEEFANDSARVVRFQREAKLLASLNHPNIASIHGLEESDERTFLVMELVEGETLAEKLKRDPIPVEEALKIALQIAEALEAAHEKGVIHRDLKPANIKVKPDGTVKVLDFGLAKAFTGEQAEMVLSDSPTISVAATQQGIILGTAAYMSPEQAKGKIVDKRADIWAFGVVMFEMLTGSQLFLGETVSETLAAVLMKDVGFGVLSSDLHPRIREMLERCLQRDPRDRYGSIGDARFDIRRVLEDPCGVVVTATEKLAEKPYNNLRLLLPWLATAVVLTAIIVGMFIWNFREPKPGQVICFAHELPEDQQLYQTRRGNINLAISKDGSRLAYSTTKGLCIRPMDKLDATTIRGSDTDSQSLYFSPDGQWICYFSASAQKMRKISTVGGTPFDLCDATQVSGAVWYEDNTILYSDVKEGGGVFRVSSNGGTPEQLVEGPAARAQILPDGESVMFVDISGDPLKIVVQSLASKERKVVFENGGGIYLPTGHIIYVIEDSYFAIQFDLDKLETVGNPVPLNLPYSEGVHSDSGSIAYLAERTGVTSPGSTLVWVDRVGNEEQLVAAEPNKYVDFKLSPDGTKLALTIEEDGNQDIWLLDLDRGNRHRLTYDEAMDRWPLWTKDGKDIVFLSTGAEGIGIYSKASNGSGKIEKLASWPNLPGPMDWSKDGGTLFSYDMNYMARRTSIAIMLMEGDHTRKPLFEDEEYNYDHPQISPDGLWLTYSSNKSGQDEVYVCSYPDVDREQVMVSVNGGYGPLWSSDGREIFYRRGQSVMACPLETDPVLKADKPKELFKGTYHYEATSSKSLLPAWGINPKDNRFLMIKPPYTAASLNKIIIVTNWFEELKQRVPVK